MLFIVDFIKNNLFSIITVIIALIAIFQTSKQIKINNNQFLFNKRLENYLLFYGMYELYKDNISLLDYCEKKNDEAIVVDIQFIQLTNNSYLKDITKIIGNPKNNDYETAFLLKLEDIKKLANEISFLFKNKYSFVLYNFIIGYQNILLEMYKYQTLLGMMINDELPSISKKTYKELQEQYNEPNHRAELYKSLDKQKNIYNKMVEENIIDKIKKEIKL